jgi:hypothetical protein
MYIDNGRDEKYLITGVNAHPTSDFDYYIVRLPLTSRISEVKVKDEQLRKDVPVTAFSVHTTPITRYQIKGLSQPDLYKRHFLPVPSPFKVFWSR